MPTVSSIAMLDADSPGVPASLSLTGTACSQQRRLAAICMSHPADAKEKTLQAPKRNTGPATRSWRAVTSCPPGQVGGSNRYLGSGLRLQLRDSVLEQGRMRWRPAAPLQRAGQEGCSLIITVGAVVAADGGHAKDGVLQGIGECRQQRCHILLCHISEVALHGDPLIGQSR